MIKNIWYFIFTILLVILLLRKFRGEKGTYNTRREIREYAAIVAPVMLEDDENDDDNSPYKKRKKSKNRQNNTQTPTGNYLDDGIDIRKKNNLEYKFNNNKFKKNSYSSSVYSDEITGIPPNFRAKDVFNSAKFAGIIKSKYKSDSDSMGENICRKYAEHIFKKPFEKARPDFLKNPVTNSNLEIDCYSKELGIGIEYNGKQHYEYCPKFHNNKQDFYNQKYRDMIKRSNCMENGISLIEVPYTVKHIHIPLYIEKSLEKLGMCPP